MKMFSTQKINQRGGAEVVLNHEGLAALKAYLKSQGCEIAGARKHDIGFAQELPDGKGQINFWRAYSLENANA